jgi:two-component system LytT family response regulator
MMSSLEGYAITAARMRALKLLIVDHDPAVRSWLLRWCRDSTAIQVVGEVESGRAAIGASENLNPDVLLVDVALPDMTGFDVLRAAGDGRRPLGIMMSHEPAQAVRAFAEGAVDYLLMPVSPDRLASAIHRAQQRCAIEERTYGQPAFAPWGPRAVLQTRYLVGERRKRLYPLAVDALEYIEADGNYVTLRVGDTEYIRRDSIKRLAADLADSGFVRIDRSVLLNIRAVMFAEPAGHGTLAFTLFSGTCLHSSRIYRGEISRVLPWRHVRRLRQPSAS